MLSRRDKLLKQPWENRRYQDHRLKVSRALPAVDARAPAPRAHVACKLKRGEREAARAGAVQRDNFRLLQRLTHIMSVNRVDNHWKTPQPDFHHKVGLFYDVSSLNSRRAGRERDGPRDEPRAGAETVKCYACDFKKRTEAKLFALRAQSSLPSIY